MKNKYKRLKTTVNLGRYPYSDFGYPLVWLLSHIYKLFRFPIIGGGNRSLRRKPPTCRKLLTNFIRKNTRTITRVAGMRLYTI